jgi:hypothetical protein
MTILCSLIIRSGEVWPAVAKSDFFDWYEYRTKSVRCPAKLELFRTESVRKQNE